MSAVAMPTKIDPLKAFTAGASTPAGRPIPLVSAQFDVDIVGGIATVVTKRVFRNDEAESIEATITFPVPVHAVVFDLEARIDGRVVKARAQRRTQARETYEDAIERGKAAVLHEEVLRGVHMLSVAHLGPGKEIEVTATWAAALTFVGDQGRLRIPLTVGDIYGRSGLPDSDDLITGGPVQTADLSVRCENGVAAVRGASLDEGHTGVALNAPIDLVVTHMTDQELRGMAADGRAVALRISRHKAGDTALNVAVLVDHSGSMDSPCSGATGRFAKHEAVIAGLRSVAQSLGDADVVDLWEFDDQLAHVGSSHDPASPHKHGGQRLLSLIARLTHPRGGTEIGGALSGAMAASDARDILLITDGQSYALDVHELARQGRRITVVLVGEDSLEANVGHLAALSGGDIFVAAGDDIADVLATAAGALRTPYERPGPVGASLDRVRVVRGNAVLEAEWRPATEPVSDDAMRHRSVAAMAASLALPVLDEERAALLAEAEGLVTHLTSLVLVDEEGAVHEGIPATRKIALPAPGGVMFSMAQPDACMIPPAPAPRMSGPGARPRSAPPRSAPPRSAPPRSAPPRSAPPRSAPHGLADSFVGGLFGSRPASRSLDSMTVDWDVSPNRLLTGDLSALSPEDAALIEQAAALPEVVAFAQHMNISPAMLVVALVARAQSSASRSAARIAKTVLGGQPAKDLDRIATLIGLD
jgi:hypothetical protein